MKGPSDSSESPRSVRDKAWARPLRYLLVVVIGYLTDYAVYAACVWAGIGIYVANTVAFLAGATTNVWLLRRVWPPRFSFLHDLWLTFAANGAMFVLGMGLFYGLVEFVNVHHYLAKLLSAAVTFGLNYVSRALFFSRP